MLIYEIAKAEVIEAARKVAETGQDRELSEALAKLDAAAKDLDEMRKYMTEHAVKVYGKWDDKDEASFEVHEGSEWAERMMRNEIPGHTGNFYRGAAAVLSWYADQAAGTELPTTPAPMAYCVTDKQKVQMVDAIRITMKNAKPATQGRCPICGGKVFKIGPP